MAAVPTTAHKLRTETFIFLWWNGKILRTSLNFTLTMTFILRYILPYCQDKQKMLPTTTERLAQKYYPGKMGGKGLWLLERFLVGKHLPQANQLEGCSLLLDPDSKLNVSSSTALWLKCLHKTKLIFLLLYFWWDYWVSVTFARRKSKCMALY